MRRDSTSPMPPMERWWREIIRPYGEALVFAVLVTTFGFTLVGVDGYSMMPNLRTGERVIVPKYETWLHRLGIGRFHRGDIVVLKPPAGAQDQHSFLGLWNYRPYFIKRIIGVPGDTLRISRRHVYIDGHKLNQSFTTNYWRAQGCWDQSSVLANHIHNQITPLGIVPLGKTITIPQGDYFVMGDNRTAQGSEDSRLFGLVPLDNIAGRAVMVVWPFVRQKTATWPCSSVDGPPKLSGPLQFNMRFLDPPPAFAKIAGQVGY